MRVGDPSVRPNAAFTTEAGGHDVGTWPPAAGALDVAPVVGVELGRLEPAAEEAAAVPEPPELQAARTNAPNARATALVPIFRTRVEGLRGLVRILILRR